MTARPKIESGPLDLEHVTFENSFVRELPADPVLANVPRQVKEASYTRVEPTPVAAPRLLAWSDELGEYLGISKPQEKTGLAAQVLGGNKILPGMQPYAARYGGHQFGHWAGQLGDGRAITLGEIAARDGSRQELQLKGAGKTPYSRTADGRAVLRSSLREFACSEAMHALGVPTTRALSLVATGEQVVRDMFYDGRPKAEPGAIVCRVAPSFIRFGNFELPAARGDVVLLKRLIDFTIGRDFPHLSQDGARDAQRLYGDWFGEVCERTARMVAQWMRIGFVHGVMNTDNLSILGLTIDYGPYGWIDNFDPDWTPNTTDAHGRRYRFGQQPQIAYWNLGRLADALAPAFGSLDTLHAGLERYVNVFTDADRDNIAAKLGLEACLDEDVELMEELQALMQRAEIDMTLFFRALVDIDPNAPASAGFSDAFYDEAKQRESQQEVDQWLANYAARVRRDTLSRDERRTRMQAANPRYVLRNYL